MYVAGTVLKALGHEATKLSMMFSTPPFPPDKECESLLTSVEKTAVALLSVYCKLPKSSGMCLLALKACNRLNCNFQCGKNPK